MATAPDSTALQDTLNRIKARSGLPVHSFPLLRAFNIDLGFNLDGAKSNALDQGVLQKLKLDDTDRQIMQALAQGLRLIARPFAALASSLGMVEQRVLERVKRLSDAGYLTRVGIILRHRALGWRSNAMVVWQVPVDQVETAGRRLAALPGITLCYQRQTVPGVWPYTLYCMIHARSRHEAMDVLTKASALPELARIRHEVLFSTHCFKQTGALIAHAKEVAR